MTTTAEQFSTKDPVIGKASRVLHFLSSDPDTVRMAELWEKAIWDEVSNINGARAEGKKEGIQEGLQRGRQEALQEKINIALKMLEEGIPIEIVVKITGLALEEVRNLQH